MLDQSRKGVLTKEKLRELTPDALKFVLKDEMTEFMTLKMTKTTSKSVANPAQGRKNLLQEIKLGSEDAEGEGP